MYEYAALGPLPVGQGLVDAEAQVRLHLDKDRGRRSLAHEDDRRLRGLDHPPPLVAPAAAATPETPRATTPTTGAR